MTGSDEPLGAKGVEHPEVLDIGPYLLGALAPAEREAVRAHLDGCGRCRQELVELSAIPALLAAEERWRPSGQVPAPPAPDSVRRRAVQELLTRRRRARRRVGLAVAGAVGALAVLLGTLVIPAGTGRGGTAGLAAAFVPTAKAPGLHATLSVQAHPWGTELDVRADDVAPSGTVVEVVAVNSAGQTLRAGTWRVTPGTVTCRASAWWPVSVVRVVELRTTSGTVLATATAPTTNAR